jgi:hypothetical protein
MTEEETKGLREHLAQLAVERRRRMARRGQFGPAIAALYRIADLIEHEQRTDRWRKATRYRGALPVWVYRKMIFHRAVYGPLMYWSPRKPDGEPYDFRDASKEVWMAARALRDEVEDLLPPWEPRVTGKQSREFHPHQLRDLADRLAAEAMRLPADNR